MADEILTTTEEQLEETQNSNQHYIEAINNLKATTVSKSKYDKLVEENKNLVNSLVNGDYTAAANNTVTEKKSIEDIMKEQAKYANKTDVIGYVETALEFRDRILEETGEDVFMSRGTNINPTQESYLSAQKTADIYRECLDYANGNGQVFINELQRRMTDNPIANMNSAYNKSINRR